MRFSSQRKRFNARLGLPFSDPGADARMLVLELSGQEPRQSVTLGVMADRVRDVVQLFETDIEPPPKGGSAWKGDKMHGIARIGGKIAMVLNQDAIFPQQHASKDMFDFA